MVHGPELPLMEPFRGCGKIVRLEPKDRTSAERLRALAAASAMPPGPDYTTVLSLGGTVDLRHMYVVEVRKGPCRESGWYSNASDLLKCAPSVELFPEALQWSRFNLKLKVGNFVTETTEDTAKAKELAAAHSEAISRRMTLENPGCTCCVVLSGSDENPAQLRVVELWESQEASDIHDQSQWHEEAEQSIIPLVKEIDVISNVQGVQYDRPPPEATSPAPAKKNLPAKYQPHPR